MQKYSMYSAFWMLTKSHYRQGCYKGRKGFISSSNIVAIDYDPGASEVNQLNRIKLMLSTAHDNAEERDKKRKQYDKGKLLKA